MNSNDSTVNDIICFVMYIKKKWTWNFWVKLDLYYAFRHIKGGFLVDFMDFEGCQENH